MTDKIDVLIKSYLESRTPGVSGQREGVIYPSCEVLYAYLTDELQGPELEKILIFLRNNPEAQQLVSKAREIMESQSGWENEKVPKALLDRAKGLMKQTNVAGSCPHCGKPITPFKKPLWSQRWKNILWLALGAGSFALSFVVHAYFYQFLTATLFFGFKWIVEQRATKTQIMIYKALADDSEPTHSRVRKSDF